MAPPSLTSALALDVGRRRVGLAGCDPLGITVSPLPALLRGPFTSDLNHLRALVLRRGVRLLVVGLPLDRSQRLTPQAQHCQRYGRRLALALDLPVAWVNEHASSWAAAENHGLQGDRSGRLDSEAAALLLRQWLLEGPEPDPVPSAASAMGRRTGCGSS